jgi:hypothetical protein
MLTSRVVIQITASFESSKGVIAVNREATPSAQRQVSAGLFRQFDH